MIQSEGLGSEGTSHSKTIAAMAEGLDGVGLVRHLHLSAALPNVPCIVYIYELPGCTPESWQVLPTEPLRSDDEALVFHQGLRAPTGPGLGIEANEVLVDEKLVAEYAAD